MGWHKTTLKICCSRGRMHRLMKMHGIYSAHCKSNAKHKYLKHHHPLKDNLPEQNFAVSVSNAVWVSDITYIKTFEGWLYPAIAKGLCTKQVVGYSISDRIDTKLTIAALNMAVRRTRFKNLSNVTSITSAFICPLNLR